MEKFDYWLFTDGASSGNPGPGGFGGILISKNEDDFFVSEFGKGEKKTTNNKMELQAVIEGLRKVPENSKIAVFTDSEYVIKGITVWIKKWRLNGWQTSLKKEVENKKIWQALDELTSARQVFFKYVPGHQGFSLNERADEIAVSFYEKKSDSISLFSGLKGEYSIKFEISNFEKEIQNHLEKKPKSKNKNIKAFSYVSLVDGKLAVDYDWENCKKRVFGRKALYRKVFNKEEEDALKSEWGKFVK